MPLGHGRSRVIRAEEAAGGALFVELCVRSRSGTLYWLPVPPANQRLSRVVQCHRR
ncbi:hypothetical protein NITHO_5240009 [Nitrolancea hollandica Lb]|uniref:Uncharacterized protein n=1 Tax=Nitrolancea hollandica Lb TaxID=1129897 RepID=I4ELR0_9BACT|nr:hypothetical protein NITHO_5240009 [Nitrolancea hollandica Lb]